jgi:phage tail sheath protein FI
MPEQFLHGIEIVEIDTGARPISTVRSSVIGLIGTAPNSRGAVNATLITGTVAANNGITYTSVTANAEANNITVQLKDPKANTQSLSVDVSGTAITVNLATDGTGAITSTATLVIAALVASAPAALLVTPTSTGND